MHAAVQQSLQMPNAITIVLFSLLSFTLAASSDWLETRYLRAVHAWEEAKQDDAKRNSRELAARLSVAMWLATVISLVAIVGVGWWVLLSEGAGLYVGTKLALRR